MNFTYSSLHNTCESGQLWKQSLWKKRIIILDGFSSGFKLFLPFFNFALGQWTMAIWNVVRREHLCKINLCQLFCFLKLFRGHCKYKCFLYEYICINRCTVCSFRHIWAGHFMVSLTSTEREKNSTCRVLLRWLILNIYLKMVNNALNLNIHTFEQFIIWCWV